MSHRISQTGLFNRMTCKDSWRPRRSCVATLHSTWRCVASRTIPGNVAIKPNLTNVSQKKKKRVILINELCDIWPHVHFRPAAWQPTSCRHSCTAWAAATSMWCRRLWGIFRNMCCSVKVRQNTSSQRSDDSSPRDCADRTRHPCECCFSFLFLSSPEHADILLHKAFLVGVYGQIDTSSMIADSMKVLHMEAI